MRTLSIKLEDLKVMKRSPDLLNNVQIGQGFAYNEPYFVLPYMGVAAILVKWPKTILNIYILISLKLLIRAVI